MRDDDRDDRVLELARRVDDFSKRLIVLETFCRDLEIDQRKEQSENRREWNGMLDGAKSTLENTIRTSLDSMAPKIEKVNELFRMNEEQISLLREASQERIERKTREKVAAEMQADAQKRKAEEDAKHAEEMLRSRHRRDNFVKIAVAVATVLTPVAAIITALLATHR